MIKGSEFIKSLEGATADEWDRAVVAAVQNGQLVQWPMEDIFVGPTSLFIAASDYLSIGVPNDFVRVPVSGRAAQSICDYLGLVLPTTKMVGDIWREAAARGKIIKPPTRNADATMASAQAILAHNEQIQGALAAVSWKHGDLTDGLKKSIVRSPLMLEHPNMLAYYGMHRVNGAPIQPLNLHAHTDTYFDYSHGLRVISPRMIVENKPALVDEVLANSSLCGLLSSEGPIRGVRYVAMGNTVANVTNPILRVGSRGAAVVRWQRAIGVTADGIFGLRTDAATRAWQKAHGLFIDGVVGPKTWSVLAAVTTVPDDPPPVADLFRFVPAKHFGLKPGRHVRLIVIHSMEWQEHATTAEACAQFFTNPQRRAASGVLEPVVSSAHFCIDSDSIVQCVKVENVAWHTPGKLAGSFVNDFSIGLEHAGFAAQSSAQWDDAYSRSMLERSAALCAHLCQHFAIPLRWLSVDDLKQGNILGITDHASCTKATGKGTHWDPGPNFPRDRYLELVKEHLK